MGITRGVGGECEQPPLFGTIFEIDHENLLHRKKIFEMDRENWENDPPFKILAIPILAVTVFDYITQIYELLGIATMKRIDFQRN
jgi:hypothetical protein